MKKQYILLVTYWLFVCYPVFAQTGSIRGTVSSGKEPVQFASVAIENTTQGTSTDERGKFRLLDIAPGSYRLIISSVGYQSLKKTVSVTAGKETFVNIALQPTDTQLDEVVVSGTMKETSVLKSPVKVEVISSRFFARNRSNNLMEAIFNVNGVQEQVSCGVCGTNSIRINGLEGPYTMVLIDGMPIMGTLSSVYGLNGIPTQAIQQIEIIKGPNSTLYGSESVAGLINVITKRPAQMPLLTIDAFATSHLENNVDFAFSPRTKDFQTMFTGNYYYNNQFLDNNNDNFADVTLNNRLALFNRWSFLRRNNKRFELSGKYYYENRVGGEREFIEGNREQLRGSDIAYGESIYTRRTELIGTYEFQLPQKIRADFSYSHHDQNSYYGTTSYQANQTIGFANFIWDKQIGGRNDFLLGISQRYQQYNDNSTATRRQTVTGDDTLYSDQPDVQYIPGVFAQNEFKISPVWSILAGARLDYYRQHGLIPSPRLNVKWDVNENTTARLNFGTGFRIVNLFTEDHAALSGYREVVIKETLQPEKSYNVALNFNRRYAIGESAGALDIDGFYTYFTNRIVPDYQTNDNQIIYDNTDGRAVTRGVAIAIDQEFLFPLDISLGITFQDVFDTRRDSLTGNLERREILFAPDWSGVFTASYSFKRLRLNVDWTGRITGPQDLPAFSAPYDQLPTRSPWYTLQNVQLTKQFGKLFTVYGGVKNLWNYTQPSPLISPDAPFSPAFDTSYVYGPLQTRRFYLGVRLELGKGEK